MTEIAQVRQNTYQSYSEGQERVVRSNRRGELVVIDFWTQLVLDGRMFHMQIGTESTPVDSTTTIADTLVWMLVDGVSGTTLLPAFADIQLQTVGNTAETLEAMLEIDRAKVRYNTGGSAFVPENMRTDRPKVSVAAAAYVGTDITTNAKTAVPGSMEIARKGYFETTPSATNEPCDFVGNLRPLFHHLAQPTAAVVGVGSVLVHFGSGTADCTGYGILQWAELPTDNVT